MIEFIHFFTWEYMYLEGEIFKLPGRQLTEKQRHGLAIGLARIADIRPRVRAAG